MQNNKHKGSTSAQKKNQNHNSEFIEMDFGIRTISSQNFSRIVALPKQALANCGIDKNKVRISLVERNGERFLKLVPIHTDKEESK